MYNSENVVHNNNFGSLLFLLKPNKNHLLILYNNKIKISPCVNINTRNKNKDKTF